MALQDTQQAIGAVTHLLEERLHNHTSLDITVGRPGESQSNNNNARLNLFLYEATFDPVMKNTALEAGQPAPLWLVLKYLITAFDESGESDTRTAHHNLGQAVRALQALSFLQLNHTVPEVIRKALKDNPEDLKITFDEVTSELLSKLMQGTDEKYRFSLGFQVRPILITPSTPPAYSLLVGVDYMAETTIGEAGVLLNVLSTDMATLDSLNTDKVDDQTQLIVYGSNLNYPDLVPYINNQAMLIITAGSAEQMTVSIHDLVSSHVLSAGQWPVTVGQPLPSGKVKKSNSLLVTVLPRITAAPVFTPDSDYGTLSLSGKLLGGLEDVITLALYQDGQVKYVYDDLTGTVNQETLVVTLPASNQPAAGTYRIILRVNSAQAKQSPEVNLP